MSRHLQRTTRCPLVPIAIEDDPMVLAHPPETGPSTSLITLTGHIMSNGLDQSARAWIHSMGERGDWGREHVLDPVMLSRSTERHFGRTLGVGCGEGRLCRMNYSEME